ncbi:MAG: tRNA pseudouridine(55) synthase TruB [Bacteroidetes bacterium]|nr:tRNA pseudouridine(55) synthase TruB [Bacteroidota bacterium]
MKTLSDNNKPGFILLIDKPIDWSSFDVIRKIRSIYKEKKIGHAGTLDPKATGLLVICVGTKTKEIHQYMNLDKEYIGTMELGKRTPSYDTETAVIEYSDYRSVTPQLLIETLQRFKGQLKQIPPMYSAIKIKGKPLYKYARRGKEIPRKERTITIHEFEITGIQMPFVHFRVLCSKGTYIRSLINDFGNAVGCGAILYSLRRTRIGTFTVDNAFTIDELTTKVSNQGVVS